MARKLPRLPQLRTLQKTVLRNPLLLCHQGAPMPLLPVELRLRPRLQHQLLSQLARQAPLLVAVALAQTNHNQLERGIYV